MMKQLKLWSGFLGLVFLLASCASTAHIEKDETTDFSKYQTFAWIDAKKDEGKKSRVNEMAEQRIKDAVTKELERTAGWRESTRNPDVLLSYDVMIERTTDQRSEAVYSRPFTRTFYNPYTRRFINVYYPSQFMGYDSYQVPLKEGTVTLTMIDADSKRAVWQGWVTDEVANSRNLSSNEIQRSVRAIFRKFDIAKN